MFASRSWISRRLPFTFAAVCAFVLTAGASSAQTPPQVVESEHENFGVAFKVSTLGIGLEGAGRIAQDLNVRGGVNFLTWGTAIDGDDSLSFDADLQLRSVAVYLDWFALHGSFHISPGLLLYNGNEFTGRAFVPGGRGFGLGGDRLISNPLDPVTGNVTVDAGRNVAGAVMIGWGNLIPLGNRRWSIPFELGVVFTGAPTLALSLTGSACNASGTNCRNIATDGGLLDDLRREEADSNRDLEILRFYPILSIGFSYKF